MRHNLSIDLGSSLKLKSKGIWSIFWLKLPHTPPDKTEEWSGTGQVTIPNWQFVEDHPVLERKRFSYMETNQAKGVTWMVRAWSGLCLLGHMKPLMLMHCCYRPMGSLASDGWKTFGGSGYLCSCMVLIDFSLT